MIDRLQALALSFLYAVVFAGISVIVIAMGGSSFLQAQTGGVNLYTPYGYCQPFPNCQKNQAFCGPSMSGYRGNLCANDYANFTCQCL